MKLTSLARLRFASPLGLGTNTKACCCRESGGSLYAAPLGSFVVQVLVLLYNQEVEIHEFIWPQDRVDHIARHSIRPEEVEEACFGRALVQRAKSSGKNPVYYVLGQTASGRHLFCVVIQFPDGKGFPVTARPVTHKEKRRFNEWKNR
jgi:hypothetical protein